MNTEGVLVVVVGVVLGYFAYDTYFNGDMDTVTTENGHKYIVRDLPDKHDAAKILDELRERFDKLVVHLQKAYPDDERTILLVAKYNPDNIREGGDNGKYTSYSINKGEKIVFCLRSRDGLNKIEDINTIVFVGLHELAHVCTIDVGHTPAFWANFKWLLENAIDIGIYVKQNYKDSPKKYCGIDITSTPLE